MLSLFTFKKILFSVTVGSAVVTPVVVTSPIMREFSWSSSSVSPVKEGLKDFTKVDIYDGESVGSFLKKSLLHKEGQEGLVESFSQELAKQWYLAQPKEWIASQIQSWDEQHESQFRNAWDTLKPQNPQRDFWDNYWGSKESMNSYALRFKSHELVQKFLTDFQQSDFKLNKQASSAWNSPINGTEAWKQYFTSRHSFSTKEELKEKDNWDKIGFFPTKIQSPEKMWEKITLGKYEFINWVYKKWIETKLPIYFWKISWNYDTEAKEEQLHQTYDFSELLGETPKHANYEFPLFSQKTISRFNEFIKKIKNSNTTSDSDGSNSLNLKQYHVSNWYSDQNTSGEIVELLDSFDTETPELASALSYLVNKHTKTTETNQKDSQSKEINKISISQENYQDIMDLFLEQEKKDKSIEINSKLIKKNNQSKFVYDVRETDSGWVFFRDAKGVHAIKLDGYKNLQNDEKSTKLVNWFNFRNLQTYVAEKSSMDHEELISVKKDWFMMFSKFLKDNFDSLFSEYYVEKADTGLLFKGLTIHKYFDNYKSTLKNLFSFRKEETFNLRLFRLRKKIIERYSGRDWELPTYLVAKNNPIVAAKSGLSSVFPYPINVDDSNDFRFHSQENVLHIFSDTNQTKQEENNNSVVSSNLLTLLERYYEEVKKLLENSSINLKTRNNGFNFADSQRIFIQDPIFDFLLDKLFSQKEFLNYIVKEEKLLNSSFFDKNKLLGEKSKLDPSSGWSALLKLPSKQENVKIEKTSSEMSSSNSATITIATPSCKYTIESESQKTELQSLFNLLVKNYLFRNYLKKIGSNYFNFWIDFANYKQPKKSEADPQQKLSDYELFSLWQNFSLTNFKNKESLLDFLLTLDYLTKNKFENFRKFMTSQLSNRNKYHYIFFELKRGQEKDSKKEIIHPFLPKNDQENLENTQKYFSSKLEMKTFIRENWKPSDNYAPKQTNSVDSNKSFPLILHTIHKNKDSIPNKNKNLFNFSSTEGLIQYIKELKSTRDIELLVEQLSLLNWQIYPSFYKADKIFYKQTETAKRGHQERKLYLEDKKKALIYQIQNKNQSVYASKVFTKEEIDKIFANDLLEKPAQTTDNTKNNDNAFDSKIFERQQGEIEGGYFIQLSPDDFSNDAKMCALFEMLPGELLGEFIIQQTDDSTNKQISQDKFFEEIQKLKIHDLKFKGHLDNRFSA